MMLLGLIWALLAPVMLLLPMAALVLLGRRLQWPERLGLPPDRARVWRRRAAAALVLLVVLALWLPQRIAFGRYCDQQGAARIHAKVPVAGFFLDDGTANSFGMRYLSEEGFDWIEARSIYKRDAYTRYSKGPDGVRSEEIATLTAEYEVLGLPLSPGGGISGQRLVVRERRNGRELASAAQARFDGGVAQWVLGVYGSASCPEPASVAGNQAFKDFYHLARNTLGRE